MATGDGEPSKDECARPRRRVELPCPAPAWRRPRRPGGERRVGVRFGGAPSPAPPEFAGAATAGTQAKRGQVSSSGAAAQAWGPRHANALEDRRDQAAAPSAPALPAPVGADGGPAPADAGAPSDPKRDPHRGVRDGPRKPEGAAPETHGSRAIPPALVRPAGRRSGRLAALADSAKAYARAAQSDNTRRAYEVDWKMFASWLRRQGLSETPPDPEAVGSISRRKSSGGRRALGRHA